MSATRALAIVGTGLLWLAAVLLLTIPAGAEEAPAGSRPVRLRIVATDLVLPGKVASIRRIAEAEGVAVEEARLGTNAGAPDPFAENDIVIIDTPRPGDVAAIQASMADTLAKTTRPWVRVGGGPPAFANIAAGAARRIAAYYASGGQANFALLATYLRSWADGRDPSAIPPAVPLPASGSYHPEAEQVFADAQAYQNWARPRWKEGAPRIAVAIPSSLVSNMETRVVDEIVRRSEAAGLAPVPFWFDQADPSGLERTLGPLRPDILIVATHLQNGAARAAEFLKLGIPVIQTVGYRAGDPAAWANAASGIPTPLVAPFLIVPETWGATDPMVIEAVAAGELVPLTRQIDALVAKAGRLAALKQKPAAEKQIALMFWNYPPGEKNLGASNLNLPRSLERLSATLKEAGYDVPVLHEESLITDMQALLGAVYHPERVTDLLARNMAVALPLARYQAWFASLPEGHQTEIVKAWGKPEDSALLRQVHGEPSFVLPLLRAGKLVIMPQLPRGERPGEAYHDTAVPPGHLYLAQYLHLREVSGADALIHFGTHGTQEWTPGKDRGLSVDDYPYLLLGDLPVFYPYIQDNVGEAVQAKRRGRAVTISHQAPPFAPSGLYDELRDLHVLIHEYQQLEPGAARDRTAQRIQEAAAASHIDRDLGLDVEPMRRDVPAFLSKLHDHLHGLAASVTPLGLHTFGEAAAPEHRLMTVLQQLGPEFQRQVGMDPEEVYAAEARTFAETPAYRLLQTHLRNGNSPSQITEPKLAALIERARKLDGLLAQVDESDALLAGLAGRFVAPGPGGDPIRNPEVPNGRNLYPFEADKVPTQAAYEAGDAALRQIIESYQASHGGTAPTKLAFSLWSSETMRHLGTLEAQILHALGLRLVWKDGGRVARLDIIPAAELGRPRIDAVIQVTGLYRDQFDGFLRLLADGIERLSRLDEPGNPIAANSRSALTRLLAAGNSQEAAEGLASMRIFSNAPGDYTTGLSASVLDSTSWEKDDGLADAFLARTQYAYGSRGWGIRAEAGNLLAEQLRGVSAATLSRSSNLHGLLSTDHPYEFLGGLSLAVRHLDGQAPALYVSDLRRADARVATAAQFLSDELRARYLNPHWIEGMKREGYAGTLEILNAVNNLWGWQVVDPSTVRADQWQAIHNTFVRDARELGLNQWFANTNPTAQRQLLERLVEAIRKGYWDAPDRTRREIIERWQELTARDDLPIAPETTQAFVGEMAAGFGLQAVASEAQGGAPEPNPSKAIVGEPQTVRGQVMKAAPAEPQAWYRRLIALLPLLLFAAGMVLQAITNRRTAFGSAA